MQVSMKPFPEMLEHCQYMTRKLKNNNNSDWLLNKITVHFN